MRETKWTYGILCVLFSCALSACGQNQQPTRPPEMLSLATPTPAPTPQPVKEGYEGTVYTHPETGYTLYYDAAWEMQESLPEEAMENIDESEWETAQRYHSVLFLLPVGEKEFGANVSVTVNRQDGVTPQTLLSSMENTEVWLSLDVDPIPDFEVISGPEIIAFDGNDGVELVFKGSYDGHAYFWRQIAFAGTDTVYLLTLTSGSEEQMDAFSNSFNTMARSLTIPE